MIVDSSVAAKWFLSEARLVRDEALDDVTLRDGVLVDTPQGYP